MYCKSKFIYNDDANEGGAGGNATDTAAAENTSSENTNTDTNNTAGEQKQELQLPDDIKAQLQELAELKAWKEQNTKAPEKTAEELSKEQEQDKAEFIKYVVDNDLLKIDELTQYESLKVKADADLVFEKFVQDFKEENSDITDAEELAEAAKEEFDKTYKLTSENEKAKERGLAKLAKDANEIRSPFETKVKTAQGSYNEEKEVRAKMPSFDKFIDEKIQKNAPDKVPFTIKKGDAEIQVEVELSKEDKEAIAKAFKTPKTFYSYNKSVEETSAALDKKINGWIKENKFEEALTKAYGTGEGLGVRKGSNTGADAPFALRQGQSTNTGKILTLEESNQKMAEARQRAAN